MSSEAVKNAIVDLETAKGRLTPHDVVDAARNPCSPLHDHFEWDDTEAAAKYRIEQARDLIRTVKVELTVNEVKLSVVRYVRDPEAPANESAYRNIAAIRSEDDTARMVVIEEMKRVSNAVMRARRIALALGVADDLDEIERMAKSVSENINHTSM